MVFFCKHIFVFLLITLIFYKNANEVYGQLHAAICPDRLLLGAFARRYMIPAPFRRRTLDNHGVAKALRFAVAAIPEIEADFYKIPTDLKNSVALSGRGVSIYSLHFLADKYVCETGVINPDTCEQINKGYECCAIVADSSPAINPRRLLEYECLDFSARTGDSPDPPPGPEPAPDVEPNTETPDQ